MTSHQLKFGIKNNELALYTAQATVSRAKQPEVEPILPSTCDHLTRLKI